MKAILLAALTLTAATPALAQTPTVSDLQAETLRKHVTSTNPETKVPKVDRTRLTTNRVDIVDSKGVIRMTLAGDMPDPIVDGIAYRRSVPVSGLIIFDENGNERGGLGFNPAKRSAQFSLDYAYHDAIGVRSLEDGTAEILMNARGPELKHPAFGDRRLPLSTGTTRLRIGLQPDGTPQFALADRNEKTRVRLTVTDEGFGAIEFLNADGKVVSVIAPERDAARNK